MIKQYTHGKDDYQLWGNVGRLLMNLEVQKTLGGAANSAEGDIWFVAMTHNSRTTGFAALRLQKNKTARLRYFYSEDADGLELETLINKAISCARENGCTSLMTLWRKDDALLAKLGFTAEPPARGTFCRYDLEL